MTAETIPDSVHSTLVYEKTVERAVFTTERKQKPRSTINLSAKGSIVKERCKQLSEIALRLFPERVIPDVDLKDLIMLYVGADKETVRSYCGYYGHVRQGRCGDSQVVGLSRKGYLELLGFMHRVGHGRWLIHAQVTLQEGVKDGHTFREGCTVGSNEKISISPRGSVCVGVGSVSAENDVNVTTSNNNNTSEKERNFTPMISPMISLSDAEKAILDAKPSTALDKSRVDWGACQE